MIWTILSVWEFTIDWLEIVSPLVTAGFGIYGTMNETKPKDGKITKPVKIAIYGIAISAAITAVIKIGGYHISIKERDKKIAEKAIQDSIRKVTDSNSAAFQDLWLISLSIHLRNLTV